MRTTQEDLEIAYTRNVLCAMVEQAVEDIRDDTVYASPANQRDADLAKESALYFLRSRAFDGICMALGVCPKRIRRAALK